MLQIREQQNECGLYVNEDVYGLNSKGYEPEPLKYKLRDQIRCQFVSTLALFNV
jgi:hypothetical protein